MAVGVVVALDVIDLDHQQREAAAVQEPGEVAVEGAPVGERVDARRG